MWLFLIPFAAAQTGQNVYREHCVVCHGKKGNSSFMGRMMGAGAMRKQQFWQDRPEDRLRKSIALGGKQTGIKSSMPAFQDVLSDEEIDAVLAYSLSLRSMDRRASQAP